MKKKMSNSRNLNTVEAYASCVCMTASCFCTCYPVCACGNNQQIRMMDFALHYNAAKAGPYQDSYVVNVPGASENMVKV